MVFAVLIGTISQISFFHSNSACSFHHQLIKDVAPDLKAVATAPDGVVEGLENKKGNVIAVQWHPEMLHRNSDVAFMNNLFKFVVDNAK